jgi:hypothetical protein
MKMRYVRQQKKKAKISNSDNAFQKMTSDNPMDYDFPEIEEYFIYNPKITYPTGNPTQTGCKSRY